MSVWKRILVLGLVCTCVALHASRAFEVVDYASLGVGSYDFDKHPVRRQSMDYRLDYEWGVSLLPLIADSFNSVEPFLQVHPTVGFEGNVKGAMYGAGGFNLDIPVLLHGVFTWGESVGAFASRGDTRPMGSVIEFRSQLEAGWQFDNNLRLTGYISHISNAHITNMNPGAEIAGIYVHIPINHSVWN